MLSERPQIDVPPLLVVLSLL